MTPKRPTVSDEQAGLAAFRAAGYCGELDPSGHFSCTRRPGHAGEHMNYYRGRSRPGDTEGYRWFDSGGRSRRPLKDSDS